MSYTEIDDPSKYMQTASFTGNGLVGTGALSEDVENHTGAIHHPALQHFFKVTFLAGGQGVVEHDDFRLVQLDLIGYFLQLAAAHKSARTRRLARAHNKGSGISSSCQDEFFKFAGVFAFDFAVEIQVNKYREFTRFGSIKKQLSLVKR